MSSTANATLNILSDCIHCGQPIKLVELDGWYGWTHEASGYYTCQLNKHHVSGKPWREYESDPESKLAEAPAGRMSTDCGNGGYPGCCYNALKDECVNPECECHTPSTVETFPERQEATGTAPRVDYRRSQPA